MVRVVRNARVVLIRKNPAGFYSFTYFRTIQMNTKIPGSLQAVSRAIFTFCVQHLLGHESAPECEALIRKILRILLIYVLAFY